MSSPLDSGHLDDGLAKRRRVGGAEGEAEVLHGNAERVEDLRVDGVLLKVNKIHLLTDLLHRSFRAQCGKIGTDVTVSVRGDLECT